MWNNPFWMEKITYLLMIISFSTCCVLTSLEFAYSERFDLRRIELLGDTAHVDVDEVRKLVVGNLRGNFFSMDLLVAQREFKELAWVSNVEIRRRWPDKLEVSIVEREAVGKWGEGGLIDKNGEYFPAETKEDLPVMQGPMGTSKTVYINYSKFSELLAPLERTITKIEINERHAWALELDNGMLLKIDNEQPMIKLKKFVDVFDLVLQRLGGYPRYVDLRYIDGFAASKSQLN